MAYSLLVFCEDENKEEESMGKMGKDFSPNFSQPPLENFVRRSCSDGSRELIRIFHNPQQKGKPSPSAVVRILEYLAKISCKSATSGMEEIE